MSVAPTQTHPRAPHRSRLALVAASLVVLLGVVAWLLARAGAFDGSSSPGSLHGSGVAAAQTRPVGPFTSVVLAGSNDVVVHVGPRRSVVVRADDNLLDRVTTQVHDAKLVVGNKSGSFTTETPMSVDVEVPALDAVSLVGSGVVSVTDVDAAALAVTLTGSGVLRADGRVGRLDVTLAGSGDAQLGQLVARKVQAVVLGSGRIVVTATKRLDAAVPGTGAIVYGGDPAQVTTSVTGTGAVIRG